MRESLEQIRQTALTAAGITRQLLDFARNGTVEKIDVDLRHVVRVQWPVLAGTLANTITAELRVDTDDLTIRTGAGFVEQVLHQLVTNGRDAMPNGGALSVDLRGTGSTVTLTVLDTGSGMTEERNVASSSPSIRPRAGSGPAWVSRPYTASYARAKGRSVWSLRSAEGPRSCCSSLAERGSSKSAEMTARRVRTAARGAPERQARERSNLICDICLCCTATYLLAR